MNWEGTVLGGKYALLTKLGQGGMGSVWRAEHIQLRSPVAVKLIDAQIVANPEALARFMREAQSAAALRSPHVVQILDYGADRGVPYIAMELLEGESLAHRLARVGRIPPAQTAHIMTHVGRAIGKAHEAGVVHRDLKPDNIFVVHNDDEEVAKVLDFGIAKASGGSFGVGTGSATRTGAILGTPYYMSPEQAEGTKLVDHRTDIWALGVIAYECLVGQRPFESEALGSLLLAICTRPLPVPSQVADVPVGFDAWFARACARELPDRFQSAREAASELRVICGAGTTTGGLGRSRVSDGRPSAVAGVAGTSQTNAYAASVGIDAQKRKGPVVVALLLALAFVVVAVAGGTAYVLRQNDAAAAASAALEAAPVAAGEPVPTAAEPPAATPSPSVSAAPVVAVGPVTAPLPQPAAAPATQATRPKTAAAKTLKPAKTAAVVDKKPVTVSAPKPTAVAPPPAAAKPAAKPSVNLGI